MTANFKETVVFADYDGQEENNNHCHQSLTTHKLIKTDINFPETTPEEEELLILILKRKAKFLAELEELRHELKTNAAVIEQMNLPENMLVAESNPHMNIRYGSTTEQQDYRNSIKLFIHWRPAIKCLKNYTIFRHVGLKRLKIYSKE